MSNMQALVLAYIDYPSLSSLVSSKPNACLSVGNKPLLWFSLNILEQSGITDVIIICQEETQSEMKSAIESCDSGLLKRLKASFHSIPTTVTDPSSFSPAHCLALVRDKLNSSLICILSALTVITEPNILNDIMIMMARTQATMVSVYSRFPKDASKAMKSSKDADVLFLESKESFNSRLLRTVPIQEIGSGEGALFQIPFPFIDRYKCVKTLHKMMDAQFYVMRSSLVDYFINKKKDLTTRQFLRKFINVEQHEIVNFANTEPETENDPSPKAIKSLLEMYSPSFQSSIQIHAFVQEEGACFRVNNLITYAEINRLLITHFSSNVLKKPLISSQVETNCKIDKVSCIGADCHFSDNTTVECSVISSKCHVGEGCKIIRSILLDGTNISDGCNIMNCVIGQGATIGEKSRLQECYVANKQKLPSKSQFVGEQLGF